MSDNKKYYWLKLKDDFFKRKEIKKLRKIAGGDTYTIIYLKLQLLSLKTDGVLIFEGIENNIIEELALELDEDVENVKVTWLYLEKHGIVEPINDEQFLLPNTIELIGSETSVAARVRKYREQQKLLQCNTHVTNGNTEIDIEIDKEIDRDIYNRAGSTSDACKEIINYLNEKANRNYKHNTKPTTAKIKARLEEGFTLDDFKKVIDIKVCEWLNDAKMQKYLRPETLFGNKFEGYLNQGGEKVGKYGNRIQFTPKKCSEKNTGESTDDIGDEPI
ncbi:conserved phage C-terminal domain-containing protein [Sedimentibacter hydroxybenzoicus DSM 7310]|uniref:Conserved phage C-terminal domain-containing protein n=1 Tax=Sedimentibacter hydroxybenzoicus DSM 7310 TaxID=1123245 RepID=A0A974GW23_SEDHY|nr:conserved phage C-terminal domain-containing protein [Sedimentibacter hydroxybenzoicus]NYB73881.1 conserved phage C-terminal domain-containing protein [Sedimentibacter hydroxybenzoicus DSM 7310]